MTILFTRQRTARTKSLALVVVGALMLAGGVSRIARAADDTAAMRKSVEDVLVVSADYKVKFAEVAKRIEGLGISDYMTLPRLASPSGLAAARMVMQQYRALQSEQTRLSREAIEAFGAKLASLPPSELRDGALRSFRATKESRMALVDEYAATSSGHADAIDGVLGWATRRGGQFRMQGDQTAFAGPEVQSELVSAARRLEAAEQAMNATAAKVEALEAELATKQHELFKALGK